MRKAARIDIAAAVILAAGSVIAVTPATTSLAHTVRDVSLPAIRLTAGEGISDIQTLFNELLSFIFTGPGPVIVPGEPLQTLQADELLFNSFLTSGEVATNLSLVNGELSAEEAVAPLFSVFADSAAGASILNGTVDDLFNAANIFTSSQNIAYDVIFGTNANPVELIGSLLATANPDGLFDNGDIGGIEGILSNGILGVYDAVGLLNDQFGLTGASALPSPTFADLLALQNGELALGNDLGADELAFNAHLTTSELAAEAAAFGGQTDALNGLVDRLINADNELLGTGENLLNFVFGAETIDPTAVTAGLLIPSDSGVFDTGSIGGLEGVADQLLAGIADTGGLTAADFATGAFDSDAFSAALSGAFDFSAFNGLDADVSAVAADLTTILTSLF